MLRNNIFPHHEFMLPSTLSLVDHCYSEEKVWRRRLKYFASRRSFAMHRRDREVMKISGRPLYCTR
jgi:hypothetical protein